MTNWDDGFEAGRQVGIREAAAAVAAMLNPPPMPVEAMPRSYVVSRACRCGETHLDRDRQSCPVCADHLDFPAPLVSERASAPTRR